MFVNIPQKMTKVTRLIVSAWLFTLTLGACTHQKQTNFSFVEKTIPINIPEFTLAAVDSFPKHRLSVIDFQVTDTGTVVTGYDLDDYRLYFYNLKTDRSKIVVFDTAITYILGYKYFSRDSILILNNASYKDNFHDSTFFWANDKGEVWKYLSLKDLPVKSIENPEYINNDLAAGWVTSFSSPVLIGDKLVIHLWRNMKFFGDPFFGNDLPIVGIMNLKTGENTSPPIVYPDFEIGKTFLGRYNGVFFTTQTDSKNAFLVSFKHTPKILKYNIDGGRIDTFALKSSVFDTIFSFPDEKSIPKGYDTNMPHPTYYALQYNPHTKQYFRLIRNPKGYKNDEFSVQIADSNLNLIAEGFMPEPKLGTVYFSDDYIIQTVKATDTSYVRIEFYKMTFRPGTNQELITAIKTKQTKGKPQVPQTVTKYIKENVKPNAENYTVVFQITGFTCGGVTEFLLDFFSQSNAKFKENEVLLVLDTQDPKTIRERLTANNLQQETNPNIIIDSLSTYSNTLPANDVHEMPRIVVVRKNKVVTDTVFSLSDEENTGEFQKFIINSGKEQLRLKK